MSLSAYLQDKSVLSIVSSGDRDRLRETICGRGELWYEQHPEEAAIIKANLTKLHLASDSALIGRIQHNVLLHYYEKFLPLCGSIASYHEFLSSHVDTADAFGLLDKIRQSGRAVLAAVSHFGGVELITPVLAAQKAAVSTAIRFTTEEFSVRARAQAAAMSASGMYGALSLIELGKPETTAALDMAAALRRGETLVSVFDERTEYSIPANLMGRTVWGGAGLHKLIMFARVPLAVVTPFMVRLPQNRYRLVLKEIPLDGKATIQAMYESLQDVLKEHLEQWYFLHEEIPFCE